MRLRPGNRVGGHECAPISAPAPQKDVDPNLLAGVAASSGWR